MEDLRTNMTGLSRGGQFMIIDYSDVCDGSNACVVRYLFHASGELKSVDHAVFGSDASPIDLQKKMDAFLGELESYRLGDIRVQLFQVEIDGNTFGLVASEKTQSVNLEPGPILTFMGPWDGEYYT
ncbi:hypothetical protein DSM3645_18191 [Blastopirellula marina DSM 3645]|uniref:Uncharacterized protein n=1 Tax=Blastopirellula marina DSM 3645 TaxID=314230 RepID=A3ZYT2_9BACT|nr:hypothetical protein DSM3645_18191 [Blastopirellula marina DSM 3645]